MSTSVESSRSFRIGTILGALLFLGCSLETDRTTLIIAQIAQEWPGIVHFALLSNKANTPERLRQLDKWNIRPIFFQAGRFEKIG